MDQATRDYLRRRKWRLDRTTEVTGALAGVLITALVLAGHWLAALMFVLGFANAALLVGMLWAYTDDKRALRTLSEEDQNQLKG